MFSDKSAVLAQINTVIQNKSFTEPQNAFDYLTVHKSPDKPQTASSKKNYTHSNNRELLNKLQQRVAELEEHGDHLLYFIHFLFQNFSDLVKNIQEGNEEKEKCVNEKITEQCLKQPKACNAFKKEKQSLTKREMDVFNLLIKGLCAKEIASRLFISETTVITHKKHLKEKFNAKNTAEFISKATTISLEDNSERSNF